MAFAAPTQPRERRRFGGLTSQAISPHKPYQPPNPLRRLRHHFEHDVAAERMADQREVRRGRLVKHSASMVSSRAWLAAKTGPCRHGAARISRWVRTDLPRPGTRTTGEDSAMAVSGSGKLMQIGSRREGGG